MLLGFYHSVMLALAWAARHPARAAGLVLFGGSARGWDPMSGPGTQALLSLIDRDWDTFVESAAHAWLGWPDPELGRLAAEWFRTATTPAIAKATMREASAIDVRPSSRPSAARSSCCTARTRRSSRWRCRKRWRRRCPDARLELLPGTTASLFFEDPEGVADRIATFAPRRRRPRPTRRLTPRRPRGQAGRRGGGAGTSRRARRRSCVPSRRASSNAEIAAALGISVNTVERHVSNVYRKIDARGRADATAWALRHGLA